MRLLRNLARRRLRTSLTIAGINIGIWALVLFSSMANKINTIRMRDGVIVDDGRVATLAVAS